MARALRPVYCDETLLSKIMYPTGGCTKIYYEGHNCSEEIKPYYYGDNNLNAQLQNNQKDLGGARVRLVEDYDIQDLTLRKEYKYVKNYNPNIITQSSGILTNSPIYFGVSQNLIAITPTYYTTIEFIFSNNSFNKNFNLGESHVQYSEIAEIRDDGSYNIYHYSTMKDVPNSNSVKFLPANNGKFLTQETINLDSKLKHFGFDYSDKSNYRGKLLKALYYS